MRLPATVQSLQGSLGNGAGLRFLSEPLNSPSFAAVKKHALTRFPGSQVGGLLRSSDECDRAAGYSPNCFR